MTTSLLYSKKRKNGDAAKNPPWEKIVFPSPVRTNCTGKKGEKRHHAKAYTEKLDIRRGLNPRPVDTESIDLPLSQKKI